MSSVRRRCSNAQDIKDQHSSSTNEEPLALGSAAGRGYVSVLAMNRAMQTLQLLWVAMLVYWLSCKFRANLDGTRMKERNIPEIRILPEAVARSERRPSKASMAIALRLRRIKPFPFVDSAGKRVFPTHLLHQYGVGVHTH